VLDRPTATTGDRCFAAARPKLWNSQPSSWTATSWHWLSTI